MFSSPTEQTEFDTRRRRIGIVVVLGLFTLAGLWLLGVVAVNLLDYRTALAWPAVPAEVISTGVELLPGAADGADAFGVVVRYSYIVDGQTYESERLRREGTERFTTRAAADEVLRAYLAGGRSELRAHYDPADPSSAVLNISPPGYLLLFVAFYWAMLLGFSIPALVRWRKKGISGP